MSMHHGRIDGSNEITPPGAVRSEGLLSRVWRRIRRRRSSGLVDLTVHFAQDDETGVWYIAHSDIPGLRVEADSVSELIRQVQEVLPDLIELNMEEIGAIHRIKRAKQDQAHTYFKVRPVFDSPLAVARG